MKAVTFVARGSLCSVTCLFFAVCGAFAQGAPAAGQPSPPGDLRVMTFNIEWGGTHVSFDKVVEAIRRAGPDIVAVQEAEGNLARLAAELEWHYDLRNHVISRHRLLDPAGAAGRYVLAEVRPRHVVAVANVHLPSDPYGEDWIRDGQSAIAVVALEQRVRLPAIKPFLDVLPQLARNGLPVFLAGDFNSPSGEDWRPAAVSRWPFRRYSIEWPVAQAIRSAGFRDSYRHRHPDPLRHPGFTWWADRPVIADYNPGPADSWQSRIDFIWYAGPAEATQSTLVGETGAPGVTIPVTPWPSDHRAVLSVFSIHPAPMPFLVAASKRRYRDGDTGSIVYNNRTPNGALVIRPAGSDGEARTAWRRIVIKESYGTVDFDEAPPPTGRYAVALIDSEGRTVSENEFWVLPASAKPQIEVGKKGFFQDEPLSLKFRNAPGNRYDWVAVYPEESDNPDAYLAWAHTGGRIEGEIALDATHAVSEWPVPPGRYTASLMADDGFRTLAISAPFEIRAR
jgi:endonuclease/exonuclease/phosphatase family metal-dependent hydrolase